MPVLLTQDNHIELPQFGTGWQTVDATDYGVPAEANGVIFECRVTAAGTFEETMCGVRMLGSSDDYNFVLSANHPANSTHDHVLLKICGLDGNSNFQCNMSQDSRITLSIVGWWLPEQAQFWANQINGAALSAGSWADLTYSGAVIEPADTAYGWFSNFYYGLDDIGGAVNISQSRPPGSSQPQSLASSSRMTGRTTFSFIAQPDSPATSLNVSVYSDQGFSACRTVGYIKEVFHVIDPMDRQTVQNGGAPKLVNGPAEADPGSVIVVYFGSTNSDASGGNIYSTDPTDVPATTVGNYYGPNYRLVKLDSNRQFMAYSEAGDVDSLNIVGWFDSDDIPAIDTDPLDTDSVSTVESATLPAPVSGNFLAIPVDTLDGGDVYDETDVLAGADAHESLTDGTDTRWLRSDFDQKNTDSYAVFTLAAGLPTTQVSIDSLGLTVRANVQGIHNNDIYEFRAQVIAADDVTPLTDAITLANADDLTSGFVDKAGTFEIIVTDGDAWIGSRFYFHWYHNKAGGDDRAAIGISQIVAQGVYIYEYGDVLGLDSKGIIQSATANKQQTTDPWNLYSQTIADSVRLGALSYAVDPDDVDSVGEIDSATLGPFGYPTTPFDLNSIAFITSVPGISLQYSTTPHNLNSIGGVDSVSLTGATFTDPHDLDSVSEVDSVSLLGVQYSTEPWNLDSVALVDDVSLVGATLTDPHNLDSVPAVDSVSLLGVQYNTEPWDLDSIGIVDEVAGLLFAYSTTPWPLDSAGSVESVTVSKLGELLPEKSDSVGAVDSVTIGPLSYLTTPHNLNSIGIVDSVVANKTLTTDVWALDSVSEIQSVTLISGFTTQPHNLNSTATIQSVTLGALQYATQPGDIDSVSAVVTVTLGALQYATQPGYLDSIGSVDAVDFGPVVPPQLWTCREITDASTIYSISDYSTIYKLIDNCGAGT